MGSQKGINNGTILFFAAVVLMIGAFAVDASVKGSLKKKNTHPADGVMGLTKEQWKKKLTKQQYHVLWEKGTERAFSGSLLNNKKKGIYVTAGCRQPVFSSKHKYESGTGWPSFWQPVSPDAVKLVPDYLLGYERTEVVSSKCGEHLGHLFKDGPKPTGLRYCINSAALNFIEDKDK